MNVTEIDKIPHTRGMYYDFIDQEVYESYAKQDFHSLKDLVRGGIYTIYRIARDDYDQIVYMRLTGELIEFKNEQMFLMHTPGKIKTMYIDGYKEHWFFIKEVQ